MSAAAPCPPSPSSSASGSADGRESDDDERSDDDSPLLPRKRRRHVVVIVLGDLGRSPRMQYHALSLLGDGHLVSLVGYAGEGLIPDLDGTKWPKEVEEEEEDSQEDDERDDDEQEGGDKAEETATTSRLNVLRLRPPSPPRWLRRGPLILIYLVLRLCGLIFSLALALWIDVPEGHSEPVDCVLVQNPPSAPLLLVSWLYCASYPLLGEQEQPRPGLVVDWHNLGYTMFDPRWYHPVRLLARLYERIVAPWADGHLCVTSAMRTWLEESFGVGPGRGRGGDNVAVLHDRPPSFFKPTGAEERHGLMRRLGPELRRKCPGLFRELGCGDGKDVDGGDGRERTPFTERAADGTIRLRDDRPALVVSSTSWTPDEDFGLLLDAVALLDEMARRHDDGDEDHSDVGYCGVVGKGFTEGSVVPPLPPVLVVVTGKGPQKSMYEERISRLNLRYVHVATLWLESADYPVLLGCADLGVSLHASTSGLDLPMKVYDMFGCHVPVLALDFACLGELVRDGENGRVFRTYRELAYQMRGLLRRADAPPAADDDDEQKERFGEDLAKLRRKVGGMTRWDENWKENARDVILRACPDGAEED